MLQVLYWISADQLQTLLNANMQKEPSQSQIVLGNQMRPTPILEILCIKKASTFLEPKDSTHWQSDWLTSPQDGILLTSSCLLVDKHLKVVLKNE